MQYNPDRAAQVLMEAAEKARRSPPAWDGDHIVTKLFSPAGAFLGDMLPGRGLALGHDLKAFGIHRSLPNVWERSDVQRAQDNVRRWGEELDAKRRLYTRRGLIRPLFDPQWGAIELLSMSPVVVAAKQLAAVITTYDGIIAARAGGGSKANDATMSKASFTTVAQQFSSLFRAGGFPVAGTYTNIPGGAVHTRASVGAWNGITALVTGTNSKYLLTIGWGATSAIDWAILMDLLVACGNISANLNTAQVITSVAQTRQYGTTLGAGVMGTLEVTAALGVTAANVTLSSYTNESGTAARANTADAMTPSCIAQRTQPAGSTMPWLNLQSGDYGIRSVESGITFSAAMGAGGVVALNLAFPLAYVPGLASNLYVERDSTTQIDGLTELIKDSGNLIGCLTWLAQTNGVTSGTFRAFARTCEG